MKIVSKSKVINLELMSIEFNTFRIKVDRIGYTHLIKRTDLEIYNLQRLLHESRFGNSAKVEYVRPDVFISGFQPYEFMKQKKYSFVWEFFWPRTVEETDFFLERKDSAVLTTMDGMDLDLAESKKHSDTTVRRKSTGLMSRFNIMIGASKCK